ncbi:polyhydroxyalkanoate synthesis repressor PhaR [Candidatus Berkiella aquae]|uniref:PHB/PHA accumulation regulator DNA-binding domain protein n=1 Tax=Candidatus Berkiella aquae TaxID=295108 RepID=A0A0Q9YVF5_9GAMM|nr:polyhydroxyalkanoate synthesis repressor PhaR [Candidatus Berkiella aquae]MCS5710218.1 polyhydroxyalkanoate synthesis repressor PhaR [Candidatus Berkiella aquae]
MSEPRVIKKYPNRRLYDTTISSYITLEDVKRLVVEQVAIKVVDARSQEDITHSTLLQIIIDQEENGPPLFTTPILQQMIRFYGGSMHALFGKMFEQGMQLFEQQQAVFNEEKDPLNMMSQLTQQNMTQWQQLQNQWMNAFVAKQTAEREEDPQPAS